MLTREDIQRALNAAKINKWRENVILNQSILNKRKKHELAKYKGCKKCKKTHYFQGQGRVAVEENFTLISIHFFIEQ